MGNRTSHEPATPFEDEDENEEPGEHRQPATRVQIRLGAALRHSSTPSLRVTGFEDEDDDEDENEEPCEQQESVTIRQDRVTAHRPLAD
jgi:hypothetical protein